MLIRFDDILEDRLERLHAAFDRAISLYDYDGRYQGVFDQMQSATPCGGAAGGQRTALGFRPGSWQQSGTADCSFADAGPAGPADLQQVQGPPLHRNRHPGQASGSPTGGGDRAG